MTSPSGISNISFYFDPSCPWTYIASRWIRNVTAINGVPLEFRPFSLAIKNHGGQITPQMELGLSLLRVIAKMQNQNPKSDADRLTSEIYLRFGEEFHVKGLGLDTNIRSILSEFSLPDDATSAINDPTLDDQISASMTEALALTGQDFGVPIIAIQREDQHQGFFGPILCRVPTGDETIKLWTHFVGLSELGCFFELKRTKLSGPWVS